MTTNKKTFEEFGIDFQEKTIQALLSDKSWAQQMSDIIDIEYFEIEYLKYICKKYFEYFKSYKTFPTIKLLAILINQDFKEDCISNIILSKTIEYLHRIKSNPDVCDLQFIKDKAFDFCRRQAFKIALEKACEDVLNDNYDNVVNRLKNAICAGTPTSFGHDFFNDYEKRFSNSTRNPIPTGMYEFDKKEILNGGLGRGELGVIIGGAGVGKSHFLVMLGSNAIKLGLNVLHYTFELSEVISGIRYDSNICEISSTDVTDNKEKILNTYSDLKSSLGNLWIKEYPSRFATINTLRTHLEKLYLTKNFFPDLIIIDYADIMRSTKGYDSLRHELKLIYEDLRSWAVEINVPIWTGSQANRESFDHEVVELKSICK